MQPVLVHSKLHVWFALRLSVKNENHFVVSVGNAVLKSYIYQHNNVSTDCFATPHTIVVVSHCRLL